MSKFRGLLAQKRQSCDYNSSTSYQYLESILTLELNDNAYLETKFIRGTVNLTVRKC